MKTTLVCTECSHRFTATGNFSWEGLVCPVCCVRGDVVGVIRDGRRVYFSGETAELPILKVEGSNAED